MWINQQNMDSLSTVNDNSEMKQLSYKLDAIEESLKKNAMEA
jgi:hypothetical protein